MEYIAWTDAELHEHVTYKFRFEQAFFYKNHVNVYQNL